MTKVKTNFICQECGQEFPRWLGKCPGCGLWNSMVEERINGPEQFLQSPGCPNEPVPITAVPVAGEERYRTGFSELDRVLGGGIVPGSLVLLGGDPGIGKSTLLLQVACALSRQYGQVLYVSGEESGRQTRLRADRLDALSPGLFVAGETNLDSIIGHIRKLSPTLVVIDSIQTIYRSDLAGAPGSIGQVRECAVALLRLAKETNIVVVLVGHVTKAGYLAGPRVLEHVVDCVLYFEGERYHSFRILRAIKNRFGSTNEIGVFQMQENGLQEVANPSEVFLAERPLNTTGSVVVASLEGTRPVLLEIQALVSGSAFGNPRRLTTGIDLNRALLMVAVLDKRIGMVLANQDIYLNVAGGLKVEEPAVDLGVCLAIASSLRNCPVDPFAVLSGEVGLTGEVRGVSQVEQRITEATKMGFRNFILPGNNLKNIKSQEKITLTGVTTVEEALEVVLGG